MAGQTQHHRALLALAVTSAALGLAAGCLAGNGGRLGTVDANTELSAEARAELAAELAATVETAIDARLAAQAAVGTNPDQSARNSGQIDVARGRVTVDQSTADKWLARGLAAGLAVNLGLTIWLSYPVGRARRLRRQREAK